MRLYKASSDASTPGRLLEHCDLMQVFFFFLTSQGLAAALIRKGSEFNTHPLQRQHWEFYSLSVYEGFLLIQQGGWYLWLFQRAIGNFVWTI
jgi:hypothetical protein